MTSICVDAMGGDESPEVVCEGIAQALVADEALEVLVVGTADVVEPFCSSHSRAKALVATEVIGMAEHPAEAVRTKRDSSIVRGCEAVRAGDAQGFFSAGSTGAVLAAATLKVGRIKGIQRPAITTSIPGLDGHETVMLDLGANADVRPDMLVQFAQMGSAYARTVLGCESPRVALLSNGTEDTKGSEAAQEAFAALSAATGIDFAGNAEGTDVMLGGFDVIVCDGFTGNIALKTLEGTAKWIVSQLKVAAKSSPRYAIGAALLKPALVDVKGRLSGDEHGGAILLGVKAPVLIGHGATSAEAIKNGTLACAKAVRGKLVEGIATAGASGDERVQSTR